MATKKISMELSDEILKAIDDYWYDKRLKNRSQAANEIIEIALKSKNDKVE